MFPPQTNEIQRVTHLNYTGWPDHGTPSQPEQLLTFISYMRHVHQSGPIITHCSAGIGRSGTLICIDVVLGLISKDADVSFTVFTLFTNILSIIRLLFLFVLFEMIRIFFCFVVWYFRCRQEHETSEAGNGPDRGEVSFLFFLTLNPTVLSLASSTQLYFSFNIYFYLCLLMIYCKFSLGAHKGTMKSIVLLVHYYY